MGELKFEKQFEDSLIASGFDVDRGNGRKHKGIDYDIQSGTEIRASERGKVVRASFVPGDPNYGYTVIIDHTPEAFEDKRHIYTLYAHLCSIYVKEKETVHMGKVLGLCGNTGTVGFYGNTGKQMHLHFEVIDTEKDTNKIKRMDWSTEGATGFSGSKNRVDPTLYLGKEIEIDGTLGDHPISEDYLESILDKMAFKLDDKFRLQVLVGGKNVGHLGDGNKKIEIKIPV